MNTRIAARGILTASIVTTMVSCGFRNETKAPAYEESHAISPFALFAYVDASGTRLLSLGQFLEPDAVHTAICDRGRKFRVRFDSRQLPSPDGNGRQWAANFDKDAGDVYRIVGDSARADDTCVLSSDENAWSNVDGAPTVSEPCKRSEIARIASARGRDVDQCRRLANASENGVFVVRFASKADDAVAAIVVIQTDAVLFADYSGKPGTSAGDVWRADDAGIFVPEDFRILFMSRNADGLLLAVAWSGSEGETETLWKQVSQNELRAVTTGYRYWSPI